jgi:DNA-directed RNA polymerase specialized sigma24 family protein
MCVREARDKERKPLVPDEGAVPRVVPSAETTVAVGQLTDMLSLAVERMPEPIKSAWRYKHLGHDETYACRQLKIPGRTYRRRITEARSILKSTLEEIN